MLNVFILLLLLIYFWYFYYSDSKPLRPVPQVTGPEPAAPFNLEYANVGFNTFQFRLNGTPAWSESVPSYLVTPDHIQEMDDCYMSVRDDQKIPAKGLSLYKFVKKNPKFKFLSHHVQDNGFIFRHGTPFYFTCQGKTIAALTLCPTGHIFHNESCKPVSSCTGQPDQTRLPHPDVYRFIHCQDGEEQVRMCPPGQVFYGGHCASEKERLCILQKDLEFFKFDEVTLFGCRNHTPVYKTCPPGTQLFEDTVCEPSDCVGKADLTKIPLRKRKRGPFEYSPGYSVCRQGKVAESVECPSAWDPMLATKENLTMLPMVFHSPSNDCFVPSLCENVWPTEPGIHVPAHDFTRNLQNWYYSKFYDQGKGYVCNDKGVKEEVFIEIGKRINDYFKVVPACNDHDPLFLPLVDRLRVYYDCTRRTYQNCPLDQFFNGSTCQPLPDPANGPVFKYKNFLPLFQFSSLESDGSIKPFPKMSEPDLRCDHGFQYLKQYHICSDPSCVPFAFLSMIPEFSLFLKPNALEKAQCKYDETFKHLRKIQVPNSLHYTFWNQKIQHESVPEKCNFGQHLETGNFIWDRTIYATCDNATPFIFCPSPETISILRNPYACSPPRSTKLRHNKNLNSYTPYPKNQFKRVLRIDPNQSTSIILNKSNTYKNFLEVPPQGLVIPDNERVNIKALHPVDLEYKYRMTYPPDVVFKYEDGRQRPTPEIADHPSKVFNLNSQSFEFGKYKFPRYRVQTFVNQFSDMYHPSINP